MGSDTKAAQTLVGLKSALGHYDRAIRALRSPDVRYAPIGDMSSHRIECRDVPAISDISRRNK